MKLRLLIVIVLGQLNVNSQISLCGDYKTSSPNLSDRVTMFYRGIKGVIVGSELNLEKDSSFIYTTCGNKMTGRWSFDSETGYLYITSNRFRIDSLNESPEWRSQIPSSGIQKFRLKGKRLYWVSRLSDGTKSIEILSIKKAED